MTPRSGLQSAIIEAGTITSVDATLFTCTVQTVTTQRRLYDCPIGGPYLHAAAGEGIYALPEPGAQVYVCIPAEGDARAFVIAYRSVVGQGASFAHGRGDATPGDLSFVGRDGNGVRVYRGGLTEVRGSALCRTFYTPSGRMQHFGSDIVLATLGGELAMESFDPSESPEGYTGSRFRHAVKEFEDDPLPFYETLIGFSCETELVSDPVYVCTLYNGGTESRTQLLHHAWDRSGDGKATVLGGVSLQVGSVFSVYQSADSAAVSLVRAPDFFAQLVKVLTEVVTVGAAAGVATPETSAMLEDLATALAAGNNYTTKALRAE